MKSLKEERRQCGHEKVLGKCVEVKQYKWGMRAQLTGIHRRYWNELPLTWQLRPTAEVGRGEKTSSL